MSICIYLYELTLTPESKDDLGVLKIVDKFTCLLKCDWESTLQISFLQEVRKSLYLLENSISNQAWIETQQILWYNFPLTIWRWLSKAASNQEPLVFTKNVHRHYFGSLAKVISDLNLWLEVYM